jgi:hypothetical protein
MVTCATPAPATSVTRPEMEYVLATVATKFNPLLLGGTITLRAGGVNV